MYIDTRAKRRRVYADEEVSVAPEATDLLFEAEDVAELVAEVTGEVVDVTADGDSVVFAIGEGEGAEEFTVTAEGDEEVLEATRRPLRGKRTVAASRKVAPRRRVQASTTRRTTRKVPSRRK